MQSATVHDFSVQFTLATVEIVINIIKILR
jgi:hypothetical protein